MNDKMTFHRIASSIAGATGCTDEEAALFLRALLDKATEALARGERVTIAGIGTFAPGEPSQEAVVWAPDPLLAEAVNEPFAAFEPVALAAGVSEDDLTEKSAPDVTAVHAAVEATQAEAGIDNAVAADEDKTAEDKAEAHAPGDKPEIEEAACADSGAGIPAVPAEAEVEAEADIIADSAPEMLEAQVVIPAAAETVVLPVADNKPEAPVEKKYSESAERLKKQFFSDDDDSSSDNREPIIVYRDRTGLNPWLMLLVGVIVGMALGYLLSITLGYLSNTSDTTYDDSADDEEMVEETTPADGFITEIADEPQTTEPVAEPEVSAPEKTESADAVAPSVKAQTSAPKVVTDTVSGHRYLTTMARKYYGNHSFWVYIYEENADKIGNPDRIRPGTVVVIPPASKYNIDASNPASVRRATAKIGEIERRTKGRR